MERVALWLGTILRNCKIWDFYPKFIIFKIIKINHNTDFPGIHEFTLYMLFAVSLKMAIPILATFVKTLKNIW